MLRYVNPNVTWSSYNKIMIAPATFWALTIPKCPPLTSSHYATTPTASSRKTWERISPSSTNRARRNEALHRLDRRCLAVPVLRSISVVVPQARVLSAIKMAATGTYAFVGSAQGAMKLNDSVSGTLLAAAVDKRVGGTYFGYERRHLPVGRC